MRLEMEVNDPEVLDALTQQDEQTRVTYAIGALRIGVLALNMARGQVDAVAVREAGTAIINEIKTALSSWTSDSVAVIRAELAKYLDPENGFFFARIEKLLENDGEMERTVLGVVGPDSALSKQLDEKVGLTSPLFKLLDPDNNSGFVQKVNDALTQAKQEFAGAISNEFSLDNPNGALSRLVNEIKGQNTNLVAEFSLDNPNGALSRLVKRVEDVQKGIQAEFSLDVPSSGLNRILAALEVQDRKNVAFHSEVREQLARIQAKKESAERTTLHGIEFEANVGSVLGDCAAGCADIFEPTGNTTGTIRNCKNGDFVIALGPDHIAEGVRIVVEAKDAAGYSVAKALEEIEEGRKNRSAQIGIFVFSKDMLPAGLGTLSRYGNDIVIGWDASDPDDIILRTAYSLARALAVRTKAVDSATGAAIATIEGAVRSVEKQLGYLDDIASWAATVKSSGEKIADRASKMRERLTEEVSEVDAAILALKKDDSIVDADAVAVE